MTVKNDALSFTCAWDDNVQGDEEFAALFSAMTEIVVLHDLVLDSAGQPVNYRLTACNHAFETITGISAQTAAGRLATEVYNTDSPPYLDIYAAVALTGKPQVFETYYPPMDKHFLVSAACLSRQRFATVTTDITRQKRSEAALRANQLLLSTAGRTARFGGWSASPDGSDIVWSDEVALIHECDPGYSPGLEQALLFYAPDSRERIARAFESCALHGVPYDLELAIRTARGRELWVRTTGEAMRDEAGAIVRVQGSLQDITERKHAEDQLRELNASLEQKVTARTQELNARTVELEKANERLRELDEIKSVFLSTVSHELRTPLTSILGYAKLTNRKFGNFIAKVIPQPGVDARRIHEMAGTIAGNLHVIEEQGLRLSRLINDFLDLNRIEAGRHVWRSVPMNPAHALQRAARTMEGAILQRQGVVLELDIAEPLPTMRLDADRFDQLLLNLLQNAVKFTPEGLIRLSARVVQDILVICVSDPGVGIPREELVQIFDSFHQTQHSNVMPMLRDAAGGQGTGLGLAICQQIVQHCDGVIYAESVVGRGATIIVELPINPETSQA